MSPEQVHRRAQRSVAPPPGAEVTALGRVALGTKHRAVSPATTHHVLPRQKGTLGQVEVSWLGARQQLPLTRAGKALGEGSDSHVSSTTLMRIRVQNQKHPCFVMRIYNNEVQGLPNWTLSTSAHEAKGYKQAHSSAQNRKPTHSACTTQAERLRREGTEHAQNLLLVPYPDPPRGSAVHEEGGILPCESSPAQPVPAQTLSNRLGLPHACLTPHTARSCVTDGSTHLPG